MDLSELRSPLTKCIQQELQGEVGVLFSGGLDSAVLTALSREHCRPVLYTVGYPNSHDLKAGEKGAQELDLPWKAVILNDDELRKGVRFLRDRLGLSDPLVISFELPLYFVCSQAKESILVSGQGADELFAGYDRYRSLAADELEKALLGDQERLLAEGGPREADLVRMFDKRLVCPYLCPDVVRVARTFSPGEMIGPEGNKLPLRRLAAALGLSAANSPKKAAQYGSGIMSAMKKCSSREGKELRSWVAEVE